MAQVNTGELMVGLTTYFGANEAGKILDRIKADPLRAWMDDQDFGNILRWAALHVDELGKDIRDLDGPQKREVIIKWLDEMIVFDGFLEQVDGWVIEQLVGGMIDKVVAELNEKYGHKDWPKPEITK